jgi:hypothetical protein
MSILDVSPRSLIRVLLRSRVLNSACALILSTDGAGSHISALSSDIRDRLEPN